MIFTQENEYSAVLDACVLVPVSLCDIVLRLAEEPAMYRPRWSEEIMAEMAKALRTKLHRTATEITYRRQQMNHAFPEAMVAVPPELLDTVELPDRDDRHVLAAAIKGQANMIVTHKVKHFPKTCLEKWGPCARQPMSSSSISITCPHKLCWINSTIRPRRFRRIAGS